MKKEGGIIVSAKMALEKRLSRKGRGASVLAISILMATCFCIGLMVSVSNVEQAYASSNDSVIAVKNASLGKVALKKGSTYALGASAKPYKLKYKSSNPKTVTVTKGGKLKAKAVGTAKVTVTAKKGKVKATRKITVKVLKPKSFKAVKTLTVSTSKKTLQVGETSNAKVTFNPKKASNKNVVFTSSNNAVATVSQSGKITALSPGDSVITVASCSNRKAKAKVNVHVGESTTGADAGNGGNAEKSGAGQDPGKSDSSEKPNVSETGDDPADEGDEGNSLAGANFKEDVESVHVEYGDAVIEETEDEDGSIRVGNAALPSDPEYGQILVLSDNDLQGIAIRVDDFEQEADGSYTLEGSRPEFEDVFDSLELNGERDINGAKLKYAAPGVTIHSESNGGHSSQNRLRALDNSRNDEDVIVGDELRVTIDAGIFDTGDTFDEARIEATGSVDVTIKPKIEYKIRYDWTGFQEVKAIVNTNAEVFGNIHVSGNVEIPIKALDFDIGIADLGLYVSVGADGQLGVSGEIETNCGINWTRGMDESPLAMWYDNKGLSSKFSLEGHVGIGVHGSITVLNFDVAEVHVEGGGKASYEATRHTPTWICRDVAAWLYLEAGYEVMDSVANVGNFKNTATREFLNKDNSFLRVHEHYDNDSLVDECQWTGKYSDAPIDAHVFGGHSYVIYDDGMETWEDAEEACVQRGGHLATISNEEENDFLYGLMRGEGCSIAYVGLKLNSKSGRWLWTTGESLNYENWMEGEPNSYYGDELYCALYNGRQWNDDSFKDSHVYICEWDGSPDPSNAGIPSDAQYCSHTGNWYKAYWPAMTWTEAKERCESFGGHLATITSEKEQAFLENLNPREKYLWIGGYRSDDPNSEWNWITGEKFDTYQHWRQGEPNNYYGDVPGENKLSMYPYVWNDLKDRPLEEQVGFICEWEGKGTGNNDGQGLVVTSAAL